MKMTEEENRQANVTAEGMRRMASRALGRLMWMYLGLAGILGLFMIIFLLFTNPH